MRLLGEMIGSLLMEQQELEVGSNKYIWRNMILVKGDNP